MRRDEREAACLLACAPATGSDSQEVRVKGWRSVRHQASDRETGRQTDLSESHRRYDQRPECEFEENA